MRAQGFERICDGIDTGNECATVISQPYRRLFNSLTLAGFLVSRRALSSVVTIPLSDRMMPINNPGGNLIIKILVRFLIRFLLRSYLTS